MNKDFILKGLQFTFFTPPFKAANQIAFVNDFIQKTDNVFSHEPQIIPLPKEAPPEIPRITLRNAEQNYVVHFSVNRMTFVFQDSQNHNPALETIYPKYRFHLSNIAQAFKSMIPIPYMRFGCVFNFLREFGEGTNSLFSERYFANNPFPDAHEIQANIHHVLTLEEWTANRWVRYRTLRKADNPQVDTGLMLEIDLNTLATVNLNAGQNETLKFFMAAKSHVENDLSAFPFCE